MSSTIEELERRRAAARLGGGQKRIDAQKLETVDASTPFSVAVASKDEDELVSAAAMRGRSCAERRAQAYQAERAAMRQCGPLGSRREELRPRQASDWRSAGPSPGYLPMPTTLWLASDRAGVLTICRRNSPARRPSSARASSPDTSSTK